jgi:hypothetical protein
MKIRGALLIALLLCAQAVPAVTQRLRVSDNRRFLVKADDSPFFYLGDTAWELFHRLDRAEGTGT